MFGVWGNSSQSNKMFQIKFMLFAVVTLMAVNSAIAIIGGQDAYRSQFPYFAYLKIHRGKYDYYTGEMTVICPHST